MSFIYDNASLLITTYVTVELQNEELQKKTAEGTSIFVSFSRSSQKQPFKVFPHKSCSWNLTKNRKCFAVFFQSLEKYLGRKLLFREISDFQVFSFTSFCNVLPKVNQRNIYQWLLPMFHGKIIFERYLFKFLNFNLDSQ